MLSNQIRQALLGGVAATNLLLAPHAADAATITLYVAANFTGAAAQLCARYTAVTAPGNNCIIAGGATGDLVSGIKAGHYSTYSQADLFFAANTAAIHSLATIPTLVTYAGFDTSTNYGWIYAEGGLELYSARPISAFDIRDGIDTITDGYPMSPALVIAKPNSAPYGFAALQLMNNLFGYTYTSSFAFPSTGVSTGTGIIAATNIGVTYDDVVNTTFQWGFVALSQIATYDPNAYVLNYGTNVNHRTYSPGPDTFDPILQGAVKVNGPGNKAFRDAFVLFLKSRDAQSILLKNGYTIPYPASGYLN